MNFRIFCYSILKCRLDVTSSTSFFFDRFSGHDNCKLFFAINASSDFRVRTRQHRRPSFYRRQHEIRPSTWYTSEIMLRVSVSTDWAVIVLSSGHLRFSGTSFFSLAALLVRVVSCDLVEFSYYAFERKNERKYVRNWIHVQRGCHCTEVGWHVSIFKPLRSIATARYPCVCDFIDDADSTCSRKTARTWTDRKTAWSMRMANKAKQHHRLTSIKSFPAKHKRKLFFAEQMDFDSFSSFR